MPESDDVSPPAPAFRREWDVFLSFRGEDTRHCFTDTLYNALREEGVRAFRDNEGMSKGDEISSSLLDAIHDSAAAIAVISPGYASSRWCLEELATICECRRLLLPVFFNVDPSHVRRQTGPFEEDFRSLEARFGEGKVVRWRDAMEKAGGVSGWVYQESKESELIQKLVRRILAELSNTPLGVASYAVGLNSRVEKLLRLLDVKSNGIRVLGLHGIGGVGKTTLAKAVYNKLVSHFEHRCFISNIREMSSQQNGLVSLQNKLLHDLGSASQVDDANAGNISVESMLHEKRVLIVLDDVDTGSSLVAKREWFYEGSRIIITTRDRDVLTAHNVNDVYEVRALGLSDSLDLFHFHALRTKKASETFLCLSEQIVSLTGGLPLAVVVFGSFLFDKRRVEEWEDALEKLRQIRPHHLQDVLRISFDGLDDEEKCIFLDIACLFVNLEVRRDEVIDIMKGCGFRAEIAINVLVARSLVTFQEKSVWMHDQVSDMGRQIVLQESLTDPSKRSRLWDHGEILTLLKDSRGPINSQGIILDFEKNHKEVIPKSLSLDIFQRTPCITSVVTYLMGLWKECFNYGAKKEGEVILVTEPFERMVCLRLLQLSNVRLVGNFKIIPPELKWLRWRKCPLKNLPSDFSARQLTVLDLSDSKIENVWGLRWWSWCNKVAENLMVMNLHGCYNLTAVPDLSRHHALEKLILERCTSLTMIHKSLGDAISLRHLNLRGCSNLEEFPNDVSGLKHLETLILSGCSKLKELPQKMECLNSLKNLLVDDTSIVRLPESIFRLTKLEVLSLNECQLLKRLPPCIGKLVSLRDLSLNGLALEELPDSIGSLVNLEKLSLMRCKSITIIPGSVGNLSMLERFWLSSSSVIELPASIGSLSVLKYLSLADCSCLTKLPVSIGRLATVVELQLDGTATVDLPDEVDGLKSLKKLGMRNCESLRSLPESIGCLVALTTLTIVNASITELPESIGKLENLTTLTLNNCAKLCRLPSSIGYLNFLHHLYMEETSVTELPESFGLLSRLMILKMKKNPYQEVSEDAETVEIANKPIVLPSSFSNLSVLKEFDARAWKLSGKIHDDFEKLSCLETLNLGHNDFHSLPCSLRGLSILKRLFLPHCENLRVLPQLPSSLLELNAESCTALETLSDLTNLENLNDLNLANCVKLQGIPGLECLKSVRRLYMGGCNSCSSVAKLKLGKLALKYMYNLCVPGNKIPDWFTPERICYSKPKNRVIKAVIVCIVVSINHQISRDRCPVVPGIEIRILRENKPKPVYATVPRLSGVPKNDEDHFYLCRYPYFRPLVLLLQEGDKIEVGRKNPPVEGVHLKKCGIHLVFENDDDYDGNENFLHESQQSVSQKLATFVGSSEDGNCIRDQVSENDGQMEGGKQSEGLLEHLQRPRRSIRRGHLREENAQKPFPAG